MLQGLVTALRHGFLSGLLVGLFAALVSFSLKGGMGGLLYGSEVGLFGGLIIGLISGLITFLQDESTSPTHAYLQHSNTQSLGLCDRLLNALLFGGCAAAGFASLYAWQSGGLNTFVLLYGLIVGFFFGIAYGLGNGTNLIGGLGVTIQPAEVVSWSWQAARQGVRENVKKGVMLGSVILVGVSCVVAGMSSLFSGIQYGLRYGLVYRIIVGFIAGVVGMLTGVLTTGWSSHLIGDEGQFVRPNEGIRRSLNHAVFAACLFGPLAGLVSGLGCGVAFGLIGGLAGWPILGAGVAIILAIAFTLQFFLLYGGIACLEHSILRWSLWRKGLIPWKYPTFLEHADTHTLIMKQGAGYKFPHNMLRDYFANLPSPTPMEKEHHD